MKVFVALAALLQLAQCGHVSVKLPYLSPAGVTYVSGYEGHAAALPYAHGAVPLHYAAPAAPLHYAAPAAIPAKVEAHHVGYAAAQVPAVAAIPFVKNVPTVSQVPVTTFEHHPAVLEKQVDVIRPAISTKKIEVRRPAIQKQFYDIEQRTIIRPAGSALVELDEPTSKLQKGPAIVQPLAHSGVLAQASLVTHAQPAFAAPIAAAPALISPSSTPGPILASTVAPAEEEAVVVDNADFRRAQFRSLQETSSGILQEQQRLGQEQQRQFQFEQQRFGQEQQRQFQQEQQRLGQEQQRQFQQEQQSRSAFFNEQLRVEQGQQQQQNQFQELSRSNLFNEQQQQFQLQQQELLRIGQEQLQRAQQMHQQFQLQQQQQQLQLQQDELNQISRSNQLQKFEQQRQLQLQSFEQQQRFQPAMEKRIGPTPMQQQQINEQQFRSAIQQNQISGVETRSNGSPLETLASIASQEQGPSLVPSLQSSSEENQINQNKLIDLLTARGGVTEIGLGRNGQLSAIGDAGQIRARVLSATPAPLTAEPANEHISTKRVVVSRPIETLQELDVVEPATKVERIAVQHPTFIKTARLDHVQVHGSVPVVGKALTPAVAHAAVPVYQKTISPAYNLYH